MSTFSFFPFPSPLDLSSLDLPMHHALSTLFHFPSSLPLSSFCSVEPTFFFILFIYITSITYTTHPFSFFSPSSCLCMFLSTPLPPFLQHNHHRRHELTCQYLSPDNPVSARIGARLHSRVVAIAEDGGRMGALTSSIGLKGTRGCTLTIGMGLFGATFSWPPRAQPWPSATARTKLHHLADPLSARHSEDDDDDDEEEEEKEEEARHSEDGDDDDEEEEVLYLSVPFFSFLISVASFSIYINWMN